VVRIQAGLAGIRSLVVVAVASMGLMEAVVLAGLVAEGMTAARMGFGVLEVVLEERLAVVGNRPFHSLAVVD
jgi:hypothetical protein